AVIGPDRDSFRGWQGGKLVFGKRHDVHAPLGCRLPGGGGQNGSERNLQLSRRRYILVSDYATHESATVTNFVVTIVMKLSRLLLSLAVAAALMAHPMGNFSVNHYTKISVDARGADLLYVLDLAELPTFELLQKWQLERTSPELKKKAV